MEVAIVYNVVANPPKSLSPTVTLIYPQAYTPDGVGISVTIKV